MSVRLNHKKSSEYVYINIKEKMKEKEKIYHDYPYDFILS